MKIKTNHVLNIHNLFFRKHMEDGLGFHGTVQKSTTNSPRFDWWNHKC